MNAALAALGWADLAATILLVGGLVAAALLVPPSATGRRWQWRAAAALGLVLPAEFGLTALRMYEVSGVHGATLVVDLLRTRWGLLWLGRSAGLAALVAGRRLPPGRLAAAAWLGGLVQLALLPRPVPVAVAARMRVQATAALAVLLPAGAYAGFVHVRHLQLLTGSPYGRTLVVKLGLVGVLLTLGATNHFGHVPAMGRGDPEAEARLVRAVRLEVVVAAVVLAVTALLGVLPMPHTHAP